MIHTVIKIGGSLLSLENDLARTIAGIESLSANHSLLVVPGGGPFADVVRAIDGQHSLSDDDAHWMAILGMDQFAILLASRFAKANIVYDRSEIASAGSRDAIPVLAPYRWLRAADPLPHSWDVTSDSIAAWVASELGARLVLVKPHGYDPATVVDRYFDRGRAPSLAFRIVTPVELNESSLLV